MFAIDTSLSTWSTGTGNGTGCGGDFNGRNGPDDILDCELASVNATVQAIEGFGGVADLGVVLYFSTAVTTDVQPGAGVQGFTTPGADLDGSGVLDVETVLRSVRTGRSGACADEFL